MPGTDFAVLPAIQPEDRVEMKMVKELLLQSLEHERGKMR
jgi:hypothetical protein